MYRQVPGCAVAETVPINQICHLANQRSLRKRLDQLFWLILVILCRLPYPEAAAFSRYQG